MPETDRSILDQFAPNNKLERNFLNQATKFVAKLDALIVIGDFNEAEKLIGEVSDRVFGESAPDRLNEIKAALLTYLEQHLTTEIQHQGKIYQIPAELLNNLTRGGENTRYHLHLEDLSAEPTSKVIHRNIRGEIETVGQISGDQTLFLTRPSKNNICTIVKRGDKVYLGYDNVGQDGNPRLVILILSQEQLDELNRKTAEHPRLS